jgi:hypothetical protein
MQLQQTVSEMIPAAMLAAAPLGPIYSFLPAGGGLPVGGDVPAGSAQRPVDQRVAELTRRLVKSLQAFLENDGDPRTVLLADFARDSGACLTAQRSTIICADLSQANPGAEWLAVSLSEAIFVVSSTDPASLKDARDKAERLRAIKRDDCCGLLLFLAPGGVTTQEAEEITGLPVCGLLRQDSDMERLARWLGQD